MQCSLWPLHSRRVERRNWNAKVVAPDGVQKLLIIVTLLTLCIQSNFQVQLWRFKTTAVSLVNRAEISDYHVFVYGRFDPIAHFKILWTLLVLHRLIIRASSSKAAVKPLIRLVPIFWLLRCQREIFLTLFAWTLLFQLGLSQTHPLYELSLLFELFLGNFEFTFKEFHLAFALNLGLLTYLL